jgi:hypothetical protein
MRRINYSRIICIAVSILIVFAGQTGFSDDTCVFMTSYIIGQRGGDETYCLAG